MTSYYGIISIKELKDSLETQMFTSTIQVKDRGKTYRYVRLVETYRNHKGTPSHRVIAQLGREEEVSDRVRTIIEALRKHTDEKYVRGDELGFKEAPIWGPVLVARKLWEDLGVGKIIRQKCGEEAGERAFVLVANSLIKPKSEHGLGEWLENFHVCNRTGERYLPLWEERGRVKVSFRQLQKWYRVLDVLIEKKEEIEKEIYLSLRDLFGLKVRVIFYDLTTLYFEGEGAEELCSYGKSKDGKGRNKQVLLGLVMANGWPIAHHIYRGNFKESLTAKDLLEDLRKRFEIEEVIFVGDAGIISEENIEVIKRENYRYLFALKRRRNEIAKELMKEIKGKGEECEEGVWVEEIKKGSRRYFVVNSEERRKYERAIKEYKMEKARGKLEKLRERVEKGELKTAERIGYHVRVAMSDYGARYFSWEVSKGGKFSYWADEEKMRFENSIEGIYILETNDTQIKASESVDTYKELCEIEDGFREIKDVIEARPVWHRIAPRIKGHIFVRSLAFLLDVALRKALRKNGIYRHNEEMLERLWQVKIGTLMLDDKEQILVSTPGKRVWEVLKAVGVNTPADLNPPML